MKTTTQNLNNQRQDSEPNEKHRVGTGDFNKHQNPRGAGISFETRRANRSLATWELLDLLHKQTPDFFERAQVVGTWVWVSFDERQPGSVTRILAELGFHWNKRRQLWQHPCGSLNTRKGIDPREKYPTYPATERQTH